MRLVRFLLLAVAALAIVAIAGAALFLSTFDPNAYKDRIVARVKADTGRDLALDGPLHLALWPKLRLEAGPLKLGNAAGFGDEPMLAAEKVQVAVATLPLLRNRVEMDTVVLHGVSVNLARNADGIGNWEDLVPPPASGEEPRKQSSGGAGLAALILGGVDVQDGRLHWQDATSGQDLVVDRITASTGALVFGQPIALKLAARIAGKTPALDGDIDLEGTINYDLAARHYVLAPLAVVTTLRGRGLPGGSAKLTLAAALDADLAAGTAKLSGLRFEGLGTKLAGEFSARELDAPQPSVAGSLEVAGADLAQIFNAFELPAGRQLARVDDRGFAFNLAFDADMRSGAVKLDKLTGKLLGANLEGTFEASAANTERPKASGKFSARGPDLAALAAVLGQLNGASSASLKQFEQAFAGGTDKSFDLAAELDVDLAAGRAALPRLSARGAGLTLQGALQGEGVDLAKKHGTLDGKLALASDDLGPLLRALGQGEMAATLKSLRVDTGVKGGLDALSLSPLAVVLRVDSPEVGKPVDLKLGATAATADLAHETASVKGLAVTGLGLDAKADLEATKILSKPAYSGRISLPTFNLRSLLASLNKPVPKTADPKVLTRVGFDSAFSGTTTGARLSGIALTLDDSRLTGDIEVTAFKGPALSFGLALDQLDADRYLEPPAKGEGKTVVTPNAAVAGAASTLPVKALRALAVKGDLTAGALTISGARLAKVKLAIDAAKGLIRLEPLAAQLYEGAYKGAVRLDARPKVAQLALDTRLERVQVAPLLKDLANNESLSGVIGFEAALKANGGNARRVKQSLEGSGRFGFDQGVFRGVDAVAILRAVEKIIECKCVVPVPKGGQTQFKSLTGTLAVKGGVVRNEDLLMQGDGFTIKGRGMLVNLNDQSLKYDLELAVTEARSTAGTDTLKLGGYTVPIACRGQVDSPTCLPDFGHILGDVAKSAVKAKLKEKLGGQGGEALQKLLKF